MDNNCTILPQSDGNIEVLSTCFCKNVLTYTCVTKPLTRHNRVDSWFCQGADGTQSNTVNTSIIVPIQSATILEDKQDVIDTQEDVLVNLTCESSFCIPAANISWFLDNKTPTVYDDDQPVLFAIKPTVNENTDSTYTTKSVLIFNPHKKEDGMSLYCNASNLDSRMASSRKLVLNVRYKPETTILINNNESYNDYYMIRNSLTVQTLQCDVRGGNPHATLTWTCYDANQTHFNTLMGVTSVVTWMAGTHGDSECTCLASHILGWSAEKRVSVYVLYPPRITNLNTIIKVFAGVKFRLSCEVEHGNPNNTFYSWASTHQPERNTTVKEFIFNNISRTDAGVYICVAQNIMHPTGFPIEIGSDRKNVTIDVQYPPKIANFNTTFEVLEGVNFSVTCYVEPGNPNVISYSWSSKQNPVRNTADQYLIIQNISRTDEGRFKCSVQNIMHPTGCPSKNGSDVESVYIDVQYKASIKTFAVQNPTVYHGDELMFACEVDSDPLANITILSPTGSSLQYSHGHNQLHFKKTSSCLEDIGHFTCISANKHNRNQPDRIPITVDVKCSPMYPTDYNPITTMTARPGKKVFFKVKIFSNSLPTNITWTNCSSSLRIPDTTTPNRVIFNTTDDMSYFLIIKSVEPWDYGNYSVTVENEIGSMIETFFIVEDNNSEPNGETSSSPNVDNSHGTVVGGTVGSVCTLILLAVLLATFFCRKRQNRHESDRLRDERTFTDDNRYEDLAISHRRKPTKYSDLDFDIQDGDVQHGEIRYEELTTLGNTGEREYSELDFAQREEDTNQRQPSAEIETYENLRLNKRITTSVSI